MKVVILAGGVMADKFVRINKSNTKTNGENRKISNFYTYY